MHKKVIEVQLTAKSFRQAQRSIEEYRKSFNKKLRTFTSELAKEGIRVAEINLGHAQSLVGFSHTSTLRSGYATTTLIAYDKQKIISEWMYYGDKRRAEVSPILMAEFGAGHYASDKEALSEASKFGMGRGTFPRQNPGEKHRGLQKVWYWQETENGEWKHSSGWKPTLPMHEASKAIQDKVQEVARRVFNG